VASYRSPLWLSAMETASALRPHINHPFMDHDTPKFIFRQKHKRSIKARFQGCLLFGVSGVDFSTTSSIGSLSRHIPFVSC